MRLIALLLFLNVAAHKASGQQNVAFNRIGTNDGIGLNNNVIRSIYQDQKGFLWVGHDNGLQRFDGVKFVRFISSGQGNDPLPHAPLARIIPVDSGNLLLLYPSLREVGIFSTNDYGYKKINIQLTQTIPPRSDFFVWRNNAGHIYLHVQGVGVLQYDKGTRSFTNNNPFNFPKSWHLSTKGIYEDEVKQQTWFGFDSGLLVYNRPTGETWYKGNNPRRIPLFDNERIQGGNTEIFIDNKRRFWIFGWPAWANGNQVKHCIDSTGTTYLNQDTSGIDIGPAGYTEYRNLYQTSKGVLWISGLNVLMHRNEQRNRFVFTPSSSRTGTGRIFYDVIHQVMEDKDGSTWIATNNGLYFTSHENTSNSIVNYLFDNVQQHTSVTDILEMDNGEVWFTSWGEGIRSLNKELKEIPNRVYHNKPPAHWPKPIQKAAKLTWSIFEDKKENKRWIGCNSGVLIMHDPATGKSEYLRPEACDNRTIRYITQNGEGDILLGTQGGRLILYKEKKFTVLADIGSIIYKIFVDKTGLVWLATHEKGLYALDPGTGAVLQHYLAGNGKNQLFNNTGSDIEQLNDSIIAFAAGALHLVNKNTQQVRQITFEDGLPVNTVTRLRLDDSGFLWMITSNGLCRFNAANNRITTYGPKDGIFSAEATDVADYRLRNGNLIFGGNNAFLSFNPAVFSTSQAPPNVAITDFKIFNRFLPMDSLARLPYIKVKNDQNSFSIYFSVLSYIQRDKLAYYYKMEGIDKDWIKADESYTINYSLLPPGTYTFKMYCETIEGVRSPAVTQIAIRISPPFWRTWWFISIMLFLVALLFYAVHMVRVNNILAVEKVRNRVARDLHDDMGSTLSTINILSSMAKGKMSTDLVKTSEYLGKISDNSQRMMEAMDDIVWSIKPSNDSMLKIAARMREFATSVLEARAIAITFLIEAEVYETKLKMEARKDLFLIFKEAINNAAKYSKAEQVVVEIRKLDHHLQMVVKDNGIGFNVEDADGNGLGNMQKRADAMKGKLELCTQPGNGTMVTLTIPLAK